MPGERVGPVRKLAHCLWVYETAGQVGVGVNMANERFMQQHYGASGYTRTPSEERPIYSKVEEDTHKATKTFMVVCDEGWRESIVCSGMYEWVADWLIEQIQGKPYANPRKWKEGEPWTPKTARMQRGGTVGS